MKKLIGAIILAGLTPAAVAAQTSAPSATIAPDPARLTAARALIDLLMPPATRDQMVQGMIGPMMANLHRGLRENPSFAATMDRDPRVKAVFDQFMAKQQARTAERLQQGLPGMVQAMANAYARRFDLRQLGEIRTFFETSTGRAYMQASFTIMNDPDVAAWQRQLMAESMAHVQEDVAVLSQQIAVLEGKK